MQWLDRDEEDLDGHEPEDPLPGFSEVLDKHRIATPSTNLADESSTEDSSDEEELSSGQAALLKVKAARELMLAKKAQEEKDAREAPAAEGGAPDPATANTSGQNEVVMDP